MKNKISFILNGEKRQLEVGPQDTLLEVLRTKLGITSPKVGCDRGDCGACTILLNGDTVKSCLILANEIDGQEVTTLEGLMEHGILPIQEKMVEKNSFQCGYCTPGFLVSTHALLKKTPCPTKEEIKEGLAGNLCRCTGYTPIIDAIIDFTKKNS